MGQQAARVGAFAALAERSRSLWLPFDRRHSLAVALPVNMFLQVCFEIANDNEAPESWLEWPLSWRKLVFGFSAHRRWHYTGPAGQPVRHIKARAHRTARASCGTFAQVSRAPTL